MPTLYISEYAVLGSTQSGALPVAPDPALAGQTVAIGGTSAVSQPFSGQTRYVRLHSDAICSRLFGKSPTATAASPRMAVDQTEYFAVNPGDRVAVITNT